MLLVPEQLPYKKQLLGYLLGQNLPLRYRPLAVQHPKTDHRLPELPLVRIQLLEEMIGLTMGYRPTLVREEPWVPRLACR